MPRPRRLIAVPGLIALLVPLAACAGGTPAPTDPPPAPPVGDHGAVAGAVELDEPALALTTVDASGTVRHLDLLDEDVTGLADLGRLGRGASVHSDGRFVLVGGPDGLDVVDSGAWTWDHEDHFHYYRAEPRVVGRLPGGGAATVATTTSSTSGGTGVFFAGSGEAVMLDTAALADGDLVERYRRDVAPHDGMLVPVGDGALLTEPGRGPGAGRVVVLDAAGEVVDAHRCARAAGTITTRVGAVVGCADGALLATVVDDRVRVEHVPYPRGTTAPPANAFAGRDGRPTVAGLATRDRVWLLDTREESWRLLESPVPLVQVSAVDDEDQHVLGLTTDGRVAVLDGATGRLLSTSRPLAEGSLRTGTGQPVLVVDQQRAYLSAPQERRLHEIDFADGARVSRSFTTPTPPLLTAGTGR